MEHGSRCDNEPDGFCYTISHSLKTAAILKKNANIFPNKCCQKCNGVYQID
jgi:hypothetical protein